ncbi:TKL/DRK protein kinase [Phytophthora cinnamomi]|uniref:TKL/DRK protein kinase n=1 Tax=Phytophthora cinnamomi TaxID=4785 RepID=UPI00355A781F|nr:TKL/DRK protein kinase [Phytophthora cinnamomi]
MARKSALAELVADHRRQEAAEEAAAASSDRAAASPAFPASEAAAPSSIHAAEAAQAQGRGMFPPQPRARRRHERQERDAKYRMERVYEEVSRRKSQVIAGAAAPRGSSETDSSATPPASDAPLPSGAAADTAGLRCTHQAEAPDEVNDMQLQAERQLDMPRPKDRKRPRGGVKHVGFTTPPPALVSGSSSSQHAGRGEENGS